MAKKKTEPNTGGTSTAPKTTEPKEKKAPRKSKTEAKKPSGGFSNSTADEARDFEGRYFKKTNEAPYRDGVIVSVDGLDEETKFIEVKYCNDKIWDDDISKVEGEDLAFIEIL